jgi:DNA repair protein RecN (Recombination protein N)
VLTHLAIRDFAIIDSVEIDLRGGLTALTGETGAGKSIIVDALQLLCGGRAGADMVRHGSERAEVTGSFDLAQLSAPLRAQLAALFEEQAIEPGDELIVRRVVTRDGKSRAWLNGLQQPLQTLRSLSESLVDIHGQHEFQSLTRPAAQREILDAYAGLGALAASVQALHADAQSLAARAGQAAQLAAERDSREALLQREFAEIDALRIAPGELPRLAEERARLANGSRLTEGARTALDLLYESEGGNAHGATSRALAALRGVAQLDPQLAGIAPLLDEALIRIDDAARGLTRYLDGLEADPARLEFIEQRLASIEAVARRQRCAPADLESRAAELRSEIAALERVGSELANLGRERDAAIARWRAAAVELSAGRRGGALALSAAITARMQELAMRGGRLEVTLEPLEVSSTSPWGLDQVVFQVSTNPGQPLAPLARVASGGELSRLSLAVQVTTATAATPARPRARGPEAAAAVSCMVFDEVDAGVGGAVAEIVGRELALLGRHGQVLCVTHLPQVAAQAASHLRVSKVTDGKVTRTVVATLEGKDRVEEIARMLGGVSVTATAREHAAELLELAVAPTAARTRGRSRR